MKNIAQLRNEIAQVFAAGADPMNSIDQLIRVGQMHDTNISTTFLGEFEEKGSAMDRLNLRSSLRQQVAASARGTWCLLRFQKENRGIEFRALIANGNNHTAASDALEHFQVRPSWQMVYEGMAKTECRDLIAIVKLQREVDENLRAIRENNLTEGDRFKRVKIGNKLFSSVTIQRVSQSGIKAGLLGADAVQTGSRRVARIEVSAATLVRGMSQN